MFRCYQCSRMKCGIAATFHFAACRGRRVNGPSSEATSVDGPLSANEGTFDSRRRPSVQGLPETFASIAYAVARYNAVPLAYAMTWHVYPARTL